MSQILKGRDDLTRLLKCPLNWSGVCEERELVVWLNFAWYATAQRYEVDREVCALISYDEFTPSSYELQTLEEGEIKSALVNVRTWQGNAKDEYLKVYEGLYRQRALRRDEMPKHYALKALKPPEVVAESAKRGEAVLRPALNETVQARLLWAALDEIVYVQVRCNKLQAHDNPSEPAEALRKMFDRHFLLVAADVNRPVGASEGQETPYLLFNLDLANGHFHTYPILEDEYREQEFRAYVQGWSYGLET